MVFGVAQLLRLLKSAKAEALLTLLTEDEDEYVRSVAQSALDELGMFVA